MPTEVIGICEPVRAELTVLNGRLLHASTNQAHVASLSVRSVSGAPPVCPRPAQRIGRAGSALRYSALDSTGHASHQEQASMIGRDSIWRNNHACDERLRRIIDPGNVA